jgi:FKBP-type peptidyl-prolyl cis-trans isomerase FkpA
MIAATALLLSSCSGAPESEEQINFADYKDPLLKVNQRLVKTEEQQIDDLVRRYGWKMQTTGTGLRYLIYKKGEGDHAAIGMLAQIAYKVNLINGMEAYNSDTDGMKSFKLGEGQVERGLEEGVLLMRQGDKAKLIIPSHLAFGLAGDDNKIPGRATLIYDVELVRVY